MYVNEYDRKLRTLTYTGLFRYAILTHYNVTYLNPAFYSTCSRPELANMVVETNRPMHRGDILIDEALTFLLTTEAHTLTGITFMDIMNMDLPLFNRIKDKYDTVEAPKRAALAKIQAEMGRQSDEISKHKHLLK